MAKLQHLVTKSLVVLMIVTALMATLGGKALAVSGSTPQGYVVDGGQTVGRYWTYNNFCSWTDETQTQVYIGGNVFMQEYGKNNVTRFRVEWKVYREGGINLGAVYNKTKYSGSFPDDSSSYWWDGRYGSWHSFKIPAGYTYRLNVKLVWERPDIYRPDFVKTVDLGVCQAY